MTIEEHNKIINSIRTEQDETKRQEHLLALSNDYQAMISESEKAQETIKEVSNERDRYAKLNNELWLKTQSGSVDDVINNETSNENKPKKRSFEDLQF